MATRFIPGSFFRIGSYGQTGAGSESRNFTTSNLGGSEYWPLDSSVSHTGDFIESRKISTTSTAAGTLFSGGTAAGKLEVSLTAAGLVKVDVAGSNIFTGIIAVNDGKLNEIVLSRTGSTASLTVNGVSDGSGTMSGTVAYDTFNARTGGTIFFIGVQADIISNDAGTDVHSWPIDEEDPSTITDRIGSNDSTAINFTSNDSETFTKAGDDWLGINGGFVTDSGWTNNPTFPYDTFDATGGNAQAIATTGGTQVFTGGGEFNIVSGFIYRFQANIDRSSGADIDFKVVRAPIASTIFELAAPIFDGSLSSENLLSSTSDTTSSIQLQTSGNVDYTVDNISCKRILEGA